MATADTTSARTPASTPVLRAVGGTGTPVVCVHGLMGRGATWSRHVPWLSRWGEVHLYDAPWHRGRDVVEHLRTDPDDLTAHLVAELAGALVALGRPAVLVGHSMGALHAWCVAARHPELVAGLVVEDMAPDFRGRTTASWEPWVASLPEEFADADAVTAAFGPVAGRYFLDAFDRTPTGWRLHGDPARWIAIAAEWGRRDFWDDWWRVQAPSLLLEASDSVTPPGQMRAMAEHAGATYRLVEAGHLVHDDAPVAYRDAVAQWLTALPD